MGLSQNQAVIVGILVAIISLLSPFLSVIYIGPSGTSISMHTLFWWVRANYPGSIMIRINEFWTAFGNFPFVAFRLGVAIQFVRYYEMKTTRFTLALTGLIGEIPPFIVILGMPPTLYLSQLAFPLPFHLLLCAILVYFRPIKRKADVFQEYESLDFYDTAVDSN